MVITLSRPGYNLATGTDPALANANFMEQFTGEVLAEFQEVNKLMALTQTHTISSGKSATFAAVGKASTKRHVVGESVIIDSGYLSNIKSTEKEIFVDEPLTSSVLVADIDMLKEHWDSRREYTRMLGRALAVEADKNIAATIACAVLANTTIEDTLPWGRDNVASGGGDGRIYGGVSGDFTTNYGGGVGDVVDASVAANIKKFAYHASEILDTKFVPPEDRYLLLRPKQYYLLAQDTDVVSVDFNEGVNGGLNTGRVLNIAGLQIVMCVNMPTTDTGAADSAVLNDMYDNLGTTDLADKGIVNGEGYGMAHWPEIGALAFHRSAVGTVKLADIGVEHDRIVERRGDLIVADYAMGHNILRPECAVGWFNCTNVV